MATTAVPVSDGGIIIGKPKWRPLESEGNLAMLLLLPTIALLLNAWPARRSVGEVCTDAGFLAGFQPTESSSACRQGDTHPIAHSNVAKCTDPRITCPNTDRWAAYPGNAG